MSEDNAEAPPMGGSEGTDDGKELWRAVRASLVDMIAAERREEQEDALLEVLDSEKACSVRLAVIAAQTGRISFTTCGFENLFNRLSGDERSTQDSFFCDTIRSGGKWDQEINFDFWDELGTFLGDAKDTRSLHTKRDVMTGLMLTKTRDGKGLWNLFYAFHLVVPGFGAQVIAMLQELDDSIPDLMGKVSAEGRFIFDVGVLWRLLSHVRDSVRMKFLRNKVESLLTLDEWRQDFSGKIAEVLSGCFEGDHFVPHVGLDAVKAFQQMSDWENVVGNVEQELKTAWEVNDEVYRDTQEEGAKSIACAVANPSATDCPLVYISQGFESLTHYRRTFALGRNCRFLQPNDRVRNAAFNGYEIKRMKEFCVNQRGGQIVNLLLNETSEGCHFWNLLFMQHIKCQSHTHSNLRPYIFGVQTNIVVQKYIVDQFILDAWECGEGQRNLTRLRELFQREEQTYSPKQTSLKKLVDDVLLEWALEVGQTHSAFWKGGNFAPWFGLPAAQDFEGQWPALVDEASYVSGLRSAFEMRDDAFDNLKANSDKALFCMVSDPTAMDCPIVFLTKSFESMTGYSSKQMLGRNRRFMHPSCGPLNLKLNGNELERIEDFCKRPRPGMRSVKLLVNEREDRELFWDLVHMEHIGMNGKPYILEVHTVLDMPMPLAIKRYGRTEEMILDQVFPVFIDELGVFLEQMRCQLRGQDVQSVLAEASYVSGSLLNYIKRNCDDYEGDHLVPKVGQEEARHFELDMMWKSVLNSTKNLLAQIWEVSEYCEDEVACAVSDPGGEDCPLVYVSRQFEIMTGYPRDWVLGRNCRFLQPNDKRRNMTFNGEDKARMREFCSSVQPAGTRIVNLLINESKSGYPFWNLLIMEHVDVEGKDYIFAVQTKIELEIERLAEILAMDCDGIDELTRLREIFRLKEADLQKCSLKAIANDAIRQWVSDFPVHLELPRFQLAGGPDAACVPFLGLMVNLYEHAQDTIQTGLEAGVRHFAISLDSEDCADCDEYVEKVGRLVSLKIAEMLNKMRLMYLHYVQQAITFTLITRPPYVSSFRALSKALSSCGYCFRCWFLDVRARHPDKPMSKASQDKLCQCWETMSAARKAGEIKGIGLYGSMGSIMQAMQCLKRFRTESPVSALAVDDYPGKEHDHARIDKFRRSYAEEYGSPPLLTYNLHGPNNCIPHSAALQEQAASLKMDACTLLLKWAEAQGYAALVPSIKDDGMDLRHKDKALPKFHRGLTRMYAETPTAKECAPVVNLALSAAHRPRRHSTSGINYEQTGVVEHHRRLSKRGTQDLNPSALPTSLRRQVRRTSTERLSFLDDSPQRQLSKGQDTPQRQLSRGDSVMPERVTDSAVPAARRNSMSKTVELQRERERFSRRQYSVEAAPPQRVPAYSLAKLSRQSTFRAEQACSNGGMEGIVKRGSGELRRNSKCLSTRNLACSSCHGTGRDPLGLHCLACAAKQREAVCDLKEWTPPEDSEQQQRRPSRLKTEELPLVQEKAPGAELEMVPVSPNPTCTKRKQPQTFNSGYSNTDNFGEADEEDKSASKSFIVAPSLPLGEKPKSMRPISMRSLSTASSVSKAESPVGSLSDTDQRCSDQVPATQMDSMVCDEKLHRQLEKFFRKGFTLEDAADMLECDAKQVASVWESFTDEQLKMSGG